MRPADGAQGADGGGGDGGGAGITSVNGDTGPAVILDAADLAYTATLSQRWYGTAPTTLQEAIDQIADGQFAYGRPVPDPVLSREDDVDASITLTAPAFVGSTSYLAGTFPLIAGQYRATISAFFQVTNINTQIYFDVFVNGSPSGPGYTLFTLGVANGADSREATVLFALPFDAVITIDLRFGKAGGAGTVTCGRAYTDAVRIGDYP
jgi:hypothetical protein